jgi:hypothetical protein
MIPAPGAKSAPFLEFALGTFTGILAHYLCPSPIRSVVAMKLKVVRDYLLCIHAHYCTNNGEKYALDRSPC